MNREWTTAVVGDCLTHLPATGKKKVQTTAYKDSGRFPVVDQGQDLVAGWTDDEEAVITEPLPLIVFGDHTRAFKFVEAPFARGADGTQLLRPIAGIDTRFFYYACRAIDLPARGYNRHFTVLKEKEVAFPRGKDEQIAIAAVLHHVERTTAHQVDALSILDNLKAAAMREIFTRGLRGEARKECEIGLVPVSWEVASLEANFRVASGGTPSRSNPAYWDGGTIPWVKTTEVNYEVIVDTEEKITPLGLQESAAKLLPAGTLLMAMYGQGVTRGKVGILGIPAACNQACAAITPSTPRVEPRYLYHFLSSQYDAIRQLAHGGQQQNLNLDIVRSLTVPAPVDINEQREIVAILDAVDRKIDLHRRKRTLLDELFKSLLHKLMTGKVRVADLDLSVLKSLAPDPGGTA